MRRRWILMGVAPILFQLLPMLPADQGTTADLEPENSTFYGIPGEILEAKVELHNRGPAGQTYDLRVTAVGPWAGSLNATSVTVDGLQSRSIVVGVKAQANLTRGDIGTLQVTATNHALSSDKDSLSLSILLKAAPLNLGAELGAPSTLVPGGVARWNVTLSNHGVIRERMALGVTLPSPAWQAKDPGTAWVAAGAAVVVPVEVLVPSTVPAGTPRIRLHAVTNETNASALEWDLPVAGALAPAGPTPAADGSGAPVVRREPVALAAFAGLTIAVPLVLVLAWEGVRVQLGWLAWRLFSRLDETRVLDHDRRARLLQAIHASPGIHFGDLRRLFELGNGTLAHHLRTLARNGLIRTRHDGFRLRHYPMQGAIDAATVLTEAQRRIADLVRARPGLRARDLARELALSRQIVSYHVQRLVRGGHLRADSAAGRPRLFPATPSTR